MSETPSLIATFHWLGRRLPQVTDALQPLSLHAMAQFDGRLRTAIDGRSEDKLFAAVDYLLITLGVKSPQWRDEALAAVLPAIGVHPDLGGYIVHQQTTTGWMIEDAGGSRHLSQLPPGSRFASVADASEPGETLYRTAAQLFKGVLKENRRFFVLAAIASVIINVLALMTSLYTMQVYDRVIPSQGLSTLYALTAGVAISLVLELVGKFARAAILDYAIRNMDESLSHGIFQRLLRIRMDQLPSSVGTLSGQLRSYEMIRSFASSVSLYLLVDAPFALLFLVVILMLAGPIVTSVPVAFLVLALIIGFGHRQAMERHAKSGMRASHRKLGLLVETVEGAEVIKASGAGWRFLNRWNELSRVNIEEDMKLRHLGESAGYYAGFMQQSAYVLLVAVGAYVASTSQGGLTSGGIIACSILSGRVLQPVGMLPGLMVQWANARSAMTSIAHLFKLKQDNHEVGRPMSVHRLEGAFEMRDLEFAYRDQDVVLKIESLAIQPGERVGILGTVGSGKSTLLKLMTGMYTPAKGSISVDGIDLQQISRVHLSERLGYLPQDTRLFAGTLRDNLLLGAIGTTDQQVVAACELTGLASIVKGHRKGFDLPIAEGGAGLSGGQRQLVALTRMILTTPDVWLLDEPTASMDDNSEARAIEALRASMVAGQTMVLVTHKPALLQLVDRVIILTPNGVAVDGPRTQVLNQITRVRPIREPASMPAPRAEMGGVA
ncbi:ATP-binding cassette domain-containing protein [Variovorax saccharolyticus]|uniref:ATP-binding cassette domain-containing protein n=1 Tax=Variovorax saccharolyticus TaxID=3053516 RepID=UPI002576CD68|nr:ATP-binding cassette domain-containing protein [Variovorax sp. J31P216]MDM0029876.1 ATP-binding cassette domain-containing protein [Variovorax sp. J31P216]